MDESKLTEDLMERLSYVKQQKLLRLWSTLYNATVLINDFRATESILLLIQLLSKDWEQLADDSSPITLNLQTNILRTLVVALCDLQDVEYRAFGLSAVCTSRVELCQRLVDIIRYHSILSSAWMVVSISENIYKRKPVSVKDRNDKVYYKHSTFSEDIWYSLFSVFNIMDEKRNKAEYSAWLEKIQEISIQVLASADITAMTDPETRKMFLNRTYITTLICDLENSDDLLFEWDDVQFIDDKFRNIVSSLKTKFKIHDDRNIIGILDIGQLDDGRKLIKELCKEFKDVKLEILPWWLISDSPTTKAKRKRIKKKKKKKTDIEIKEQTTLAPSVNETQPEGLSEGLCYFDPSVTFKMTITYSNMLNKHIGTVKNDEINDYFCLEIKQEPDQVFGQTLVDGTNMVEKQWYHARFYEYNPLDNIWRYHPHVIRLNRKVNLGAGEKGSFRDLLEVWAVERRIPVAGKIFRPEHKDSHRIHIYVADIRCQAISQYLARQFTKEFGTKYFVDMVGAAHVHVFEDRTCRKIIEFFNVEFHGPEDRKFQKLTNNADFVNKRVSKNHTDLATAFSHYTYLKSEGKLLVVDLQGWIYKENGIEKLMLTDPCIHAPMWEPPSNFVGNTNISRKGMDDFWKKQHRRCNDICRELGLERPNDY